MRIEDRGMRIAIRDLDAPLWPEVQSFIDRPWRWRDGSH
jgi:hypothetical protein